MPEREAARKLNESYQNWKERSLDSALHPVRDVLNHISDKWSLTVLATLASKPYRFGELRREIPEISQRMLTQTLTDLQQNGLINRVVYPTKPPSVEYSLSGLGMSLMIPLWELVHWATLNANEISYAREIYTREGR